MNRIKILIRGLAMALVAAFLFSFSLLPKTIFTIKVRDVDGNQLNLSKYRGKKMVFIILSGKENDSMLTQLSSFQNRYKDSAAVIGILSLEDGYSSEDKMNVIKTFKATVPAVLLTEGMYTRRTSAGQSELMQWLTHKEKNFHFDGDIAGAGHKFFIDEAGVLYGVIGPRAPLTNPIFQRIMSKAARQLPPLPVQHLAEGRQ